MGAFLVIIFVVYFIPMFIIWVDLFSNARHGGIGTIFIWLSLSVIPVVNILFAKMLLKD